MGGHGGRGATALFPAAAGGSPVGGGTDGGNGVFQLREVGRQRFIVRDREEVRVLGADRLFPHSPTGKIVALAGGRGDRGGGALRVGACARDEGVRRRRKGCGFDIDEGRGQHGGNPADGGTPTRGVRQII